MRFGKKIGLRLCALTLSHQSFPGICEHSSIWPPVQDTGRISTVEFEKKDHEIIGRMEKEATITSKLNVYFRPVDKTTKPLENLDQSVLLQKLIDIAADPRPLLEPSADMDWRERNKFDEFRKKKMESYNLIGRFCDKKAGVFLISRIEDTKLSKEERIAAAWGLMKVNRDIEWKDEFRKFYRKELKSLDPQGKGRAWLLLTGMRTMSEKEECDFLETLESHPDPKMRDLVGRVERVPVGGFIEGAGFCPSMRRIKVHLRDRS